MERGRIQGLPKFLLLAVTLSKLQNKIIMSEYVVRQWLFIDIETVLRVDFLENLAALRT